MVIEHFGLQKYFHILAIISLDKLRNLCFWSRWIPLENLTPPMTYDFQFVYFDKCQNIKHSIGSKFGAWNFSGLSPQLGAFNVSSP
mgnify:FL=1